MIDKVLVDEGSEGALGSFLGDLPEDVREILLRGTQQATYRTGATIRESDSAPLPGIVLEGLIRSYVWAEDGREATVTYSRPGDAIGVCAPLVKSSPMALQALEETTVMYFNTQRYEMALATEVALAHTVMERMALEIQRSSAAVRGFAFGRVRQRLAAHLISLAAPDKSGKLVARVTQQGLAEAVGSVRDVVSRAMAQLSTCGLVVTSHGRVVITDEDGLWREAALN
jgi:CRP/FNR family transcriptional regulator